VVGFAGFFRDGLVTLSRDDALLHFLLIGMKGSMVLLDLRNRGPQGFGTLAAAIADVKRNNLAGLGVHGDPHPLLLVLLLHKAPHCVRFSLELVDEYVGWTGGKPSMEMIGAVCQAFDHEVQQPRQADTYRTAHPTQGDTFASQLGNLRTSLGRNAQFLNVGAQLVFALFT